MNPRFLAGAAFLLAAAVSPAHAEAPTTILNASYDIGRELYAAIDKAFVAEHAASTGTTVTVDQSHGGSSRQARAIIEGLEADVVTFNQVTDIDALAAKGLVAADWQTKFPDNASPYYSLPAFLVRAGNPKNVRDWSDLVRDDVKVIFPNPKTSGNARYTYLAAYAFAKAKYGEGQKTDDFIKQIFNNVPVFDTGGRAATTTFVERQTGDVLVTFEAETNAIRDLAGKDKYEVVVPSISVLAEFPVTLVDKYADKHGTRALATAYLEFLYSEEGQTILAKQYNRVNNATVAARFKDRFPAVKLVRVEDEFGGWDKVNKEHLNPDAKLDQLFGAR